MSKRKLEDDIPLTKEEIMERDAKKLDETLKHPVVQATIKTYKEAAEKLKADNELLTKQLVRYEKLIDRLEIR